MFFLEWPPVKRPEDAVEFGGGHSRKNVLNGVEQVPGYGDSKALPVSLRSDRQWNGSSRWSDRVEWRRFSSLWTGFRLGHWDAAARFAECACTPTVRRPSVRSGRKREVIVSGRGS